MVIKLYAKKLIILKKICLIKHIVKEMHFCPTIILVTFKIFRIIKEKALYAYVYKFYIEQNKMFPYEGNKMLCDLKTCLKRHVI